MESLQTEVKPASSPPLYTPSLSEVPDQQYLHLQQQTVENSEFAKSVCDWRLKSIVCRLTVSLALWGPAEQRRSPISGRLQREKHEDKEKYPEVSVVLLL